MLSLEDTELVACVLLERGMPVQVIRPHVEERRHLEAGVVEIVELEGRDLEDEQPRSTRLLDTACQASPGVAGDGVRHAGSLEHVVEHVDHGRLSVGACDGRHPRFFTEQFEPEPDFREDRDALRTGCS